MYIRYVLLLNEGLRFVLLLIFVAVVSGSRDATLRVWDIESGECTSVLQGHVAAVRWSVPCKAHQFVPGMCRDW